MGSEEATGSIGTEFARGGLGGAAAAGIVEAWGGTGAARATKSNKPAACKHRAQNQQVEATVRIMVCGVIGPDAR